MGSNYTNYKKSSYKSNSERSSQITLTDIHLGKEILGDRGLAVTIGVKPLYQYKNGQPTDEVIGASFNCYAPDIGNKRFNLKVYGCDPDVYKESIHAKSVVKLEITDFKGKFYPWKGNVYFTAYAKEVKIQ